MRDASPEVPVVAVSWVCSVVACVVRNAEQARLTRTTRTFITEFSRTTQILEGVSVAGAGGFKVREACPKD